MGGCLSTPADGAACRTLSGIDAGGPLARLAAGGSTIAPPRASDSLSARAKSGLWAAPRDALMPMEVIVKVQALQQALTLLSGEPLLALPDAAEVLAEHLGVDLVGVYVYSGDVLPCAVLMASFGTGAAALEREIVSNAVDTSVALLRLQHGGEGGGRLIVRDAAQSGTLPPDYRELAQLGLGSLATVTVGAPGSSAPLGALVLGKREPGAFDPTWSSVWLAATSTGLMQHMRPPQVALAAAMLRNIHEAADPVAAISALLQSGSKFMLAATNIPMRVRLALVEPARGAALLFESARGGGRRSREAASAVAAAAAKGSSVSLPLNPADSMAVRELPLGNTLLASAVSLKKARFVRDVATYIQNSRSPARDVFTHTTNPVSSVVVVPLLVREDAFGAIYFTQDQPCDFTNIQETLLGFVHCVTLELHHKLSGEIHRLRNLVDQANHPQSCDGFSQSMPSGPNAIVRHVDTSESDGGSGNHRDQNSSELDVVPPLASASGRLSKVSSKRLCTEAMLKVLQQEIRQSKRRSVELSFVADHLMIGEQIGAGGYGAVYRGAWHKRPAAIKVMNKRSSDCEAVSDAMEMAVLSSLQHPNIVQVYSCLTDMVEAPVTGGSITSHGSSSSCSTPASGLAGPRAGAPRYRRMMPGDDEDAPTYNIIVMEFCDRGTLGDAVRRARLFHQQLENGSIGVDLASVVDILVETASSLEYMHRVNLLHGDVKLDNILLKSDPLHALGVTPKLADFGLTKILREDDYVVNHSGAGTLTHLAPELFTAGSKITAAVDVYAFGILMWEIYTCKRAYAGLSREAITDRVLVRGARPVFPAGAPPAYAALAAACWAHCPAERPSFSEVVARLQALADSMAAAAALQWPLPLRFGLP